MKRKTKRTLAFISVAFLVIAALIIGAYSRQQDNVVIKRALESIRTSIYLGLIVVWAISINRRVVQKLPRRFLIYISVLLFLWVFVRAVKWFYVEPFTVERRYLWYCYYYPFLFVPVCAFCLSLTMGKRDDYTLPKWTTLLFLVTASLFALVITNDFHQLVFVFPEDAVVFHDGDYSHGIGFYFVAAWILGCMLCSILILISKYRLSGNRKTLLLPFLPIAVSIIYSILYAFDIRGKFAFDIRGVFIDLTIVIVDIVMMTFEICMQIGLIRTNTLYSELFTSSASQALITDDELNIAYAGRGVLNMDKPLLERAISEKDLICDNHRIRSSEIDGGYVIWQEDISKLIRLREELEFTNEYLSGKNTALTEKYKTDKKRKRLEENNRLYNRMQDESADKLLKYSRLLLEFEQCNDAEREETLLLQISIILAYLKRRNNLIFISNGQRYITMNELCNCINESIKNLGVFGISCTLNMDTKAKVPFKEIILLYDALEEILESTALSRPSYFISVKLIQNSPVMTLRISGIADPDLSEIEGLKIVQEYEDEWYLEYSTPQEGGAI